MAKNLIRKEEAENYKIEKPFENLPSSSSDFVDYIKSVGVPKTPEEIAKVNTLLEQYFFTKNKAKELSKKFQVFFEEEVEKEKKLRPPAKFIDFLVLNKISGTQARQKKYLIEREEAEEFDIKKAFEESREEEEPTNPPRFIFDENGELTAIEVRCKCGELIRIDFEK